MTTTNAYHSRTVNGTTVNTFDYNVIPVVGRQEWQCREGHPIAKGELHIEWRRNGMRESGDRICLIHAADLPKWMAVEIIRAEVS